MIDYGRLDEEVVEMSVAIRAQQIGSEEAIFIGPMTLVASKSEPGTWHSVENGHCDCKGFEHRGHCRHLHIAKVVEEADRTTAQPVEPIRIMPRRRWHPQIS